MRQENLRSFREILLTLTDLAVFAVAAPLSFSHNLIAGALLMLGAVASYFLFVYWSDAGNVLSLKAVFSGSWMFTIGLSTLRLLFFQRPWERKTWLLLALAQTIFLLTFSAVERFLFPHFDKSRLGKVFGKIGERFPIRENRLFTICVVTTLIGIGCLVCNVLIKGYLPFFVTDNEHAYEEFYTKFKIFFVAATAVSGLCYYTIKTGKIGRAKKTVLWFCIVYQCLIMPVLIASREVLVAAVLSLTVTVVTLHKKKLLTLILCIAIALGGYGIGTWARHLSNDYLQIFIAPEEEISEEGQEIPTPWEIYVAPDIEGRESSSLLTPNVAFLYSYFATSHDNFNEAVAHNTELHYGLYELIPFGSILRFEAIRRLNPVFLPQYRVRYYLNASNLITYAYYDFGSVGCLVFMGLWALAFALIEQLYLKRAKPFILLTLGNTMTPVALCFFESWMSVFSVWLLWGTGFLLFLAAVLPGRRKETETND